MEAAVIVACGGTGARFREKTSCSTVEGESTGKEIPEKQFIMLAGKPVLAHTLDVLERHPDVGFVILILSEQQLNRGKSLVSGLWPEGQSTRYQKVKAVLPGGSDRQASVAKGISALADYGWQGPVLIQDGVRPCTSGQVYDRVIKGVLVNGNAVAAIRLRDTVKRADIDGVVQETLDRRELWQIQTPQGFWMRDLQEAYDEGLRLGLKVTDDAALVEALGRKVHLVEGDPANIKLTYPEDAVVLEAFLLKGIHL